MTPVPGFVNCTGCQAKIAEMQEARSVTPDERRAWQALYRGMMDLVRSLQSGGRFEDEENARLNSARQKLQSLGVLYEE